MHRCLSAGAWAENSVRQDGALIDNRKVVLISARLQRESCADSGLTQTAIAIKEVMQAWRYST